MKTPNELYCHEEGNMRHIGKIIEKQRQALNMSRRELAENICSEKYIYLIEKGERTPSVGLLKLLGDKLGIHLFSYHNYIDSQEPLKVRELVRAFYMCRINLDLELLNKLNCQAVNMPDFKNEPWCFETRLNKIYHSALCEKKCKESIVELNNLLNESNHLVAPSIFLINTYSLMSSCYLILNDKSNSIHYAVLAYNEIDENTDIELYDPLLTKASVNLMGANYINEEFDVVINIGEDLLKAKQFRDSYGKIYFVQLLLSLAYYAKGNLSDAIIYLKKSAYFLMSEIKHFDIEFFKLDKRFHKMLDELSPHSEIIDYFRKEYRI